MIISASGEHQGLDALEDLVRPLLNNEGSMQTHETRWGRSTDQDGYHKVFMEYSAENAFGGGPSLSLLAWSTGRPARLS